MERKFKGVWIPADTWLDRNLSITEKVMMVEIGSLETDARGCYASNAHFAEFFGLSISRVSEIISGLAAKGMLDVEQIREGKRVIERRIRVVPVETDRRQDQSNPFDKSNTPSENAANPFGKHVEPPSENTQGSNTKILSNTKSNKALSEKAQAEKGLLDAVEAFDLFWKSSLKNGSKKKAFELFQAYCKRTKTAPMAFAMVLINDTAARKKAQQFGFDKLHITTYLSQERWSDQVPAAETGKPSAFATDFDGKTYTGTANDDFADIFKDDE
jgi:hypothetical protein